MSNLINLPVGFSRLGGYPLDKTSVFNTLSEAESYAATDPSAYTGQVLSCLENNIVYGINSSKQLIPQNGESDGMFKFWSGFSSPPVFNSNVNFFTRISIQQQQNSLMLLNKNSLTNFTSILQSVGGTITAYGYTSLTSLDCQSNQLTSIALGGSINIVILNLNDNYLTSIDITGLTKCSILFCSNNQLTEGSVNSILTTLDSFDINMVGPKICSLDGPGNAIPSNGGLTAKSSLESKGWILNTN